MQLCYLRVRFRCGAAHLKRKKAYEAQIQKIQGSRLTLETQMVTRKNRSLALTLTLSAEHAQMTLENANVTVDALSAMKSGQKSMKKLNKQMCVVRRLRRARVRLC
mgnify:CR=1 FL=1